MVEQAVRQPDGLAALEDEEVRGRGSDRPGLVDREHPVPLHVLGRVVGGDPHAADPQRAVVAGEHEVDAAGKAVAELRVVDADGCGLPAALAVAPEVRRLARPPRGVDGKVNAAPGVEQVRNLDIDRRPLTIGHPRVGHVEPERSLPRLAHALARLVDDPAGGGLAVGHHLGCPGTGAVEGDAALLRLRREDQLRLRGARCGIRARGLRGRCVALPREADPIDRHGAGGVIRDPEEQVVGPRVGDAVRFCHGPHTGDDLPAGVGQPLLPNDSDRRPGRTVRVVDHHQQLHRPALGEGGEIQLHAVVLRRQRHRGGRIQRPAGEGVAAGGLRQGDRAVGLAQLGGAGPLEEVPGVVHAVDGLGVGCERNRGEQEGEQREEPGAAMRHDGIPKRRRSNGIFRIRYGL